MKFLILILTCFFFHISCNTSKLTTAKSRDIDNHVLSKPVLVELDIKTAKVTGEATSNGKNDVESLKKEAVHNALLPSKGDVLVEPNYIIEKSGNTTLVKVNGFPATYKSFRPMSDEEYKVYLSRDTVRIFVTDDKPNKLKKKKTNSSAADALTAGLVILKLM